MSPVTSWVATGHGRTYRIEHMMMDNGYWLFIEGQSFPAGKYPDLGAAQAAAGAGLQWKAQRPLAGGGYVR